MDNYIRYFFSVLTKSSLLIHRKWQSTWCQFGLSWRLNTAEFGTTSSPWKLTGTIGSFSHRSRKLRIAGTINRFPYVSIPSGLLFVNNWIWWNNFVRYRWFTHFVKKIPVFMKILILKSVFRKFKSDKPICSKAYHRSHNAAKFWPREVLCSRKFAFLK